MCITFETLSESVDNARMRIQDLFEDLEAQFDAEFSRASASPNEPDARIIEVNLKNSFKQQLIAPIFGHDFLAGLDPISPIWHIYPTHSVRDMRVPHEQPVDLPTARIYNCTIEKFVQSLPHPSEIRWRIEGPDEYLRSGVLRGITLGMLRVTELSGRELYTPIAALQQLSIEAVDNFGGDF